MSKRKNRPRKATTSVATARAKPLATGRASGKIILFGEHAVVYGRPAIAAPVQQVMARAAIFPDKACTIEAVDMGLVVDVASAPETDPFARIVRLVSHELAQPLPAWRIVIHSDIPIAAGLGSGAAIAAAIARALLAAWNASLSRERLSALVYEVEKIHHGTPSGIDNTVVAFQQPVYFERGHTPQPFSVARPLHFLITDTGVASPTRGAVADVRAAWERDQTRYESYFDTIGDIVRQARSAIETGDLLLLGRLMTANQQVLAHIDVSSPELDSLIAAAISAGALGAKLSGGGRGGNMIALVTPTSLTAVHQALEMAGATRIIQTTVSASGMV